VNHHPLAFLGCNMLIDGMPCGLPLAAEVCGVPVCQNHEPVQRAVERLVKSRPYTDARTDALRDIADLKG
jgi:hypothetical protein